MADRSILVIDNDLEFQSMVAEAMHPFGVGVHTSELLNDGAGIVPLIQRITPELIILAVETSNNKGYGASFTAKRGVAKNIPIILVSATIQPSDDHQKKARADAYLDKRALSANNLAEYLGKFIRLDPPAELVEEPI